MTSFITQPTYLPWIGIFKAIDVADTFVFYDDVQFERKSWQNRNRVQDPLKSEPAYLTVPVAKHHRETAIREIQIADLEFYQSHLRKLASWYAASPFYESTLLALQDVYSRRHTHLADLTSDLTMALANHIGLKADFRFAHDFNICGDKHTRPLAFARTLGSTVYLTQAGTRDYTDIASFRVQGIEVIFLEFAHPVYRQPREPFTPYLSVVDMLMNIGPQESLAVIKSIKLEAEDLGYATKDQKENYGATIHHG